MKVVDWNQYRMRRQARLNGGHTMPLGNLRTVGGHGSGRADGSDRIRMDCLHRYVRAQLLPRTDEAEK